MHVFSALNSTSSLNVPLAPGQIPIIKMPSIALSAMQARSIVLKPLRMLRMSG